MKEVDDDLGVEPGRGRGRGRVDVELGCMRKV